MRRRRIRGQTGRERAEYATSAAVCGSSGTYAVPADHRGVRSLRADSLCGIHQQPEAVPADRAYVLICTCLMSSKLDHSGQLGILVGVMLETVGPDVTSRDEGEGDEPLLVDRRTRTLVNALNRLDRPLREVLILRTIGGRKANELARCLQKPPGEIKANLAAAEEALAEDLSVAGGIRSEPGPRLDPGRRMRRHSVSRRRTEANGPPTPMLAKLSLGRAIAPPGVLAGHQVAIVPKTSRTRKTRHLLTLE